MPRGESRDLSASTSAPAIAIDDDAGQPVTLAVDDAVGRDVLGQGRTTQCQGIVETPRHERAVDRLVFQGEDADGDRRAGMGIARRDEPAVGRDDADRVAGLHRIEAGGDGAREDPRMPGAHRCIPARLQGERPHRALLDCSH